MSVAASRSINQRVSPLDGFTCLAGNRFDGAVVGLSICATMAAFAEPVATQTTLRALFRIGKVIVIRIGGGLGASVTVETHDRVSHKTG